MNSIMDTSERVRRKVWPEALKREIVAAASAPGASVSVVARQYDVNANLVFTWRRLYGRAGRIAAGAGVFAGHGHGGSAACGTDRTVRRYDRD